MDSNVASIDSQLTNLKPEIEELDPIDIKAGIKTNEGIVDNVMSKNPTHAIYTIKGERSFCYRTLGALSPKIAQAISRIENARARAQVRLKNTPDDELDTLCVNVLSNILTHSNVDEFESEIIKIENYVDSLKYVQVTLGAEKSYIVWIDHDGDIKYHYDRDMANITHSVVEVQRLASLGKALLPLNLLNHFNRKLGAALVTAFITKPGKDFQSIFNSLEQYIYCTISNDLRIKYLLSTSCIATITICLSYLAFNFQIFSPFIHASLIVIIGGFLGTFISVLERSKSLNINDSESVKLIILQGGLRVILGGIFGFIAYAAAISGLAFTIFKDSSASLILLGIAAGFSERLIPDLIQGFSHQSKENLR